jgi:hypothetical protein
VCRALRVLCAAPSSERLAELKRATVSAHWELVGGATSIPDLLLQVGSELPDVLVLHSGLGEEAVVEVRRVSERLRIVTVGDLPGADEHVDSLHQIGEAILGLPRPGGPVRL